MVGDKSKKKSGQESGQAVVEYLLILGFVAFAAIGMAKGIFVVLDNSVLAFGGRLEKKLKTGRTPVYVWGN